MCSPIDEVYHVLIHFLTVRYLSSVEQELNRLRAIDDPITRAAQATAASAEAQDLFEQLNDIREQSIYELFKQIGGTKAAAAFRLSRASLYRIVWRQESKDPDPFVQQRLKARRETQVRVVSEVAAAFAAAGVRSGKDLFDPMELGPGTDKEE
jgi:hypothetical protein